MPWGWYKRIQKDFDKIANSISAISTLKIINRLSHGQAMYHPTALCLVGLWGMIRNRSKLLCTSSESARSCSIRSMSKVFQKRKKEGDPCFFCHSIFLSGRKDRENESFGEFKRFDNKTMKMRVVQVFLQQCKHHLTQAKKYFKCAKSFWTTIWHAMSFRFLSNCCLR